MHVFRFGENIFDNWINNFHKIREVNHANKYELAIVNKKMK